MPGTARVVDRRAVGADVWAILTVGAPLIVNNLASISVGVADTLMAAHLGPRQLAGVALGNGVWIAIFLLGLGMVMALGPTVAQHFGAGRESDIGHDLRQGLWLAAGVSVLVVVALRHASPLFAWFDIEPAVARLAQGYLDYLSWGVPAAYGYHAFKQMNEGVGRTVAVMAVMMLALPLNVLFNYIFLFGRFGMPAMGAPGCGLGSALAFWLMFAMLAGHARATPCYRRFDLWRALEPPDLRALHRLLLLGVPIGISLFLQSGLFTAIALLIGALGSAAVAAHQIALNYCGLVFMVPLGLAMALTVRVGQAAGRADLAAARRVGFTGFVLCGLCTVVSAFTTWVFAEPIVALYSDDPRTTGIALTLFPMAAALQFADGLQVAAGFALRGLKDTRVPLLLNAATYWGVGFTLAWGLGRRADAAASDVWVGIVAALWVAAALLIGRFARLTARLVAASAADRG